ncbi:hypothetical protein NBRC116492_00710 [Aurantivibrio infirmus]
MLMVASKKEKQTRELDPQLIAKAAMAVVDEQGVAGFTMRTIASALNVTPMALYHHVKDKAGLAALLVDGVMREVALPPTTGDWREDLWAMSEWSWEITLAHPAVSRLRREYQVWTPAILQKSERWLSLWQQSGLELSKALLAASSSGKAIAGLAEEEIILRDLPMPDAKTLSQFPNAKLMFDKPHEPKAEFELAVRALIDGIYSKLSQS